MGKHVASGNEVAQRSVVVYAFDYDNCISGLFPFRDRMVATLAPKAQKQHQNFKDAFWKEVAHIEQQHPGSRKLVMVGSARQDHSTDLLNRAANLQEGLSFGVEFQTEGEGLVTHDLALLVEWAKARGYNWELHRLLTADGQGPVGQAWQNANLRKADVYAGDKSKLLSFQVRRLSLEFDNQCDIHMYFFDDCGKILEGLRKASPRLDNFTLHLIRMDWYEAIAEGKPPIRRLAKVVAKKQAKMKVRAAPKKTLVMKSATSKKLQVAICR